MKKRFVIILWMVVNAFLLAGCQSQETEKLSFIDAKVISVNGEETVVQLSENETDKYEATIHRADDVLIFSGDRILMQDELQTDDTLLITYKDKKISVIQVVNDPFSKKAE